MSNAEKIFPSELDLHAFLDDELGAEEREHVREWLIKHPEKSKELREIKLREDLLRNAIKYSVNGQLPAELTQLCPRKRQQAPLMTSRRFRLGLMGGFVLAIAVSILGLVFI